MMDLKTPLGWLRLLAILEGISYLLFGVTMPLKYGYDLPGPNYVVGMAHGLLFIAYNIFVLYNAYRLRWGWQNTFWSGLASLLPFGTFVADARIFKPLVTRQ